MKLHTRIIATVASVVGLVCALGVGSAAFAEEQQSGPIFEISIDKSEPQKAAEDTTWVIEGFNPDDTFIEVVSVDGKAVSSITNKPQEGQSHAPLETRIVKLGDGIWSFGFKYHPEDDAVNSGIPEVDFPAMMTIKSSASASATTPTVSKPAGVTVAVKAKSFKLSWKKVKSASSYIIVYGTSKSQVKNGKGTVVSVSPKATSKTIKKLKAKKTYYVSISACKSYVDQLGNNAQVYSALTVPKKVTVK